MIQEARCLILVASVCLLIARIVCEKIEYKDCGSTNAKIVSMQLSPCDNVSCCSLKRGTSVDVKITFTPEIEVTKLTATMVAIYRGSQIALPLPNRNGCVNSGLVCPLKKNATVTITQRLKVDMVYPKVSSGISLLIE
ncbi:unnamed protein product [Soboliphyme baturini]|uniref:ML domain-containing protein n=1 Tax=Soboliphyme baturini TaxID=241478 RepID=A0A183IPE8_9BILA|nr:unnamed protein product [Soboliphyme baturini]